MSKAKKILGIDLGTTYSCVASINEYGQPEVIPNAEGERTTPSVVWFDGKKAIVGQEAKEMANIHPDNVCTFVKRNMGNEDFTFDVEGTAYTPEHVSSLILRKLVQDAQAYLGEPIRDVVITCPAYFFIKEREATKRAGEIAGLNVLQIVNEPTAAAFAYGIRPKSQVQDQFVLVYDLGGGTFDASIIHLSETGVEVICTDGDHQLGGKDWDDRLVAHLSQCFTEQNGGVQPNDIEFYYDVLQKSEQCKKQLTDRKTAKVTLSFQGNKATIEVTREEFESLTADLLSRTIDLTKELFAVARKKGCNRINQLILVGGSSRMPQVPERLKKEFNLEPQLFEPDEAVAKGAAMIGNNCYLKELMTEKLKRQSSNLTLETATAQDLQSVSQSLVDEYQYSLEVVRGAMKRTQNVSSKTFGIMVLGDYDESGRPVLSVSNLIYRNTPLPIECKAQYATIADQQSIVIIELIENSCNAPIPPQEEPSVSLEETTTLWKGELPIKPDLPKYSPIDVTFQMDEEGRLSLLAYDPASGGMLRKTIPEQDRQMLAVMNQVTEKTRELVVE
ncbi:MAG: Hsp70 family protein [Thermoguttaceae bacterium]